MGCYGEHGELFSSSPRYLYHVRSTPGPPSAKGSESVLRVPLPNSLLLLTGQLRIFHAEYPQLDKSPRERRDFLANCSGRRRKPFTLRNMELMIGKCGVQHKLIDVRLLLFWWHGPCGRRGRKPFCAARLMNRFVEFSTLTKSFELIVEQEKECRRIRVDISSTLSRSEH